MTALLVRSVTFGPDGSVAVEYCRPAVDAFANGVLLNHALFIPADEDYDEEIEAVREALYALIEDVLEDLPHLPPAPLNGARHDEDDDDDDDDEQRPDDD